VKRYIALMATLGCLIALAACSSDSGSDDRTVKVTLRDYDVVLSPTVSVGKVTFAARNDGEFVHEIVVVKTDLAPAELPRDENGMFDELGAGVTFIDEVENIPPGATKELTVDLQPGKYYLLCNKLAEPDDPKGHFEHGMYQRFTAVGARTT